MNLHHLTERAAPGPPEQSAAEPDEVAALQLEVDQLREAMASRAEIEQAKGVIVALYRCPPEEAFQVLVRWSQHSNTKLRVVAAEVVRCAEHGAMPADVASTPDVWARRAT